MAQSSTDLHLPSSPTELKLGCRGCRTAQWHLAQQLVEGGERVGGELGVEAEEISSLVDATLEDELSDSFPVVAVLFRAVAAL